MARPSAALGSQDEHKPINAGLSPFLSFVTLGIYGISWDYRLHTDPEKVYPEFYSTEDIVLNSLRNAAG